MSLKISLNNTQGVGVDLFLGCETLCPCAAMGVHVFRVCWHKTLKGFNLLMMLRPSQVHLLLLVLFGEPLLD